MSLAVIRMKKRTSAFTLSGTETLSSFTTKVASMWATSTRRLCACPLKWADNPLPTAYRTAYWSMSVTPLRNSGWHSFKSVTFLNGTPLSCLHIMTLPRARWPFVKTSFQSELNLIGYFCCTMQESGSIYPRAVPGVRRPALYIYGDQSAGSNGQRYLHA